MRARLLDLGDVNAVRSQSVGHAVAAAMGPADDPAVVLLRPFSAYVSIGHLRPAASEVDAEFCRDRRLPVIRRLVGEEALLIDEHQLLLWAVVPGERALDFGLSSDPGARLGDLARVPVAAYRALGIEASFHPGGDVQVDGRKLSTTAIAEIGAAVCFAAGMMFDFDGAVTAAALGRAGVENSMTSIRRELTEPPGLTAIAEALIAACESCYGLELIPSLPTPEEMDAIYEWDERLLTESEPHLVS